MPGGVAAEADEDLMREKLSRYGPGLSGYSGRIFGWRRAVGGHCQIFAVYGDGVWEAKGLFVARSRAGWGTPTTCSTGSA